MATVLLVDDVDSVREVLRLWAERRGLDVVGEGANGREAVELAERLQPDIACTAPTGAHGSASSTARARRSCAGRSMRPRWPPADPAAPTTPLPRAESPRPEPHPRLLTIARKLARRSFHVLRELGPEALEPVPMR
jgi:hypothetical protein